MAGKAISKKKDAELAGVHDYGDLAGTGYEGMGADEFAIPFINLLQANSPEISEGVKGAAAGKLFNTTTQEVFESLNVIPVMKTKAFVEWVPRNKGGGGFVKMWPVSDQKVQQAISANGGSMGKIPFGENELVETHYVYVVTLDEAAEEQTGIGLIAFTSTKITPMKKWFTALRMLKGSPPMFANRCKIETVAQKNDLGPFFNFKIGPAVEGNYLESLIAPDHALLAAALECKTLVDSGKLNADYSKQESGTGDDAEKPPPF